MECSWQATFVGTAGAKRQMPDFPNVRFWASRSIVRTSPWGRKLPCERLVAMDRNQPREALSHLVTARLRKQGEHYEPKRLVSVAGTSKGQISPLAIHCCLQKAVQLHQKLTLSQR